MLQVCRVTVCDARERERRREFTAWRLALERARFRI